VQLAGFAMLVRQNVVVREGLNLTLDLTMTVGAINETVEVRADTPLLESRTVAQGGNISGDLQRALCIPQRQPRPRSHRYELPEPAAARVRAADGACQLSSKESGVRLIRVRIIRPY
jgi:hypothetical protein